MNESVLKALSEPCTKTCHDINKYCLDDCQCDSSCARCCEFHVKTHAHEGSDTESENVASEKDE